MYLALYRKYRPMTFDDVISQEHITTTLKNQIITDQIAHAYLFTGTRGTGKTTCAKIMAKAVNCLSPVNGSPCGECASCKAIADGSTDIIEIDAASNSGVDSIRQIRDEVIYTPIDCKYKVYIIDEAHQLSKEAKNALLKTLEEPPAHVIFILATTDYYAITATIASRCQQFLFSKIDPQQSAQRLLEVAEKEQLALTPSAAALIARLSDGAMRDALSLLDQCAAADSNITEELVRRISGVADSGWLFGISEAAINKEPAKALKILDTLVTQGKDLSRFIEELTLHLRNLMLTKSVPNSGLVAAGEDELKKYEKQCKTCSAEEIMRWVELVSESLDRINRMKQTGQARLLAESLLIRLCTPKLDNDVSSFAARLGAVENKIENLRFSDIKPKADEQPIEVSPAARDEPYPPTDPEPPTDVKPPDYPEPTAASVQEQEIPFDPPYTEVDTEPAPSIQQILHSEPENGSEPDDEELPPPPEPVDGQMYFMEPPQQLDAPLLREETEAVDGQAQTEAADEAEERAETVEAPQPITETDEELPADAQPLPQWSEIVSALPVATRSLLASTQAFLHNGRIFIQASVSARKILEKGERAELLRESVKSVLGGRFPLFLLREREEAEENEDLVSPMLQRAKDMGIDVTVNDK
ncbi:MAG: DNA polymerase III subunit gamma/tau [Oscillospiraceae bacterium]|nr:DNA polymerase III subunit gamma/tau [Oscillospiraceae bacterium]